MLGALMLTTVTVALTPQLHVVSSSPFTVAGRHFHAHETVTVTLRRGREAHMRLARTSAAGSFTVVFSRTPIRRCTGWSVRAIGGRRDAASLRSLNVRCPPHTGGLVRPAAL